MDTQELKLSIILEEEVEIVRETIDTNYFSRTRGLEFLFNVLFCFYFIYFVSYKDDDHCFKLNIYPLTQPLDVYHLPKRLFVLWIRKHLWI